VAPAPFGGQAVVEGVMIRGQRHLAVAVRAPDGEVVLTDAPIGGGGALRWRRVPFVRGLIVLAESLSMGMRALRWSTAVAEQGPSAQLPAGRLPAGPMLALALAIFCVPVLLTFWVGWVTGSEYSEVVAEGLARVALLAGYVALLGSVPEFARLFAYHGAEHRAIHAWEHGRALTVAEVRAFPNAHARCGTAFLLTLGVLAGVVFLFFGAPPFWLRLLERLFLAPVIAALAYEVLRLSQRYAGVAVVAWIFRPNLWMQRLTTRDPDDAQIEVAIAALERAVALEAAEPATARVAEPLS